MLHPTRIFDPESLRSDGNAQRAPINVLIENRRHIDGFVLPLQSRFLNDQITLGNFMLVAIVARVILQPNPFRLPLTRIQDPHTPEAHGTFCRRAIRGLHHYLPVTKGSRVQRFARILDLDRLVALDNPTVPQIPLILSQQLR